MARVPVILDFGDSLTAGYGLPAGQAFVAHGRRLDPAQRVVRAERQDDQDGLVCERPI